MIAAVNCARALDALFQWLSPTSPHRASLDADERRAPLTGQPVRGAFSCDCLGKRRQRSAPINRVSRFDGRHKQRPYSLGRIIMPLIHERGFPLLNPKLTRHLGCARGLIESNTRIRSPIAAAKGPQASMMNIAALPTMPPSLRSLAHPLPRFNQIKQLLLRMHVAFRINMFDMSFNRTFRNHQHISHVRHRSAFR